MPVTGDAGILLRRIGGAWSAPDVRAYRDEAHLQGLIAEEPGWIPGVEQDAFTVTELPTAGGPMDVCIVGRSGSITVVECKLASNSERRRMVVGQVIDYAAAVWMDGPEAFVQSWHARANVDLRAELDDSGVSILERNIHEARIDLCLAVDAIDDDLRRLVEYLNQATRVDVRVTALQLAYAKHDDIEILIPSTFGGEIAEAKLRAAGQYADTWTRARFLDALSTDEDRELAERLFARVEGLQQQGTKPPLWFGKAPGGGIYLHPHGLELSPVWLAVNSHERLMLGATWNSYPSLIHDDAYEGVATLMGQSHVGPCRTVAVASLDFESLWSTILQCALDLNSRPEGEPDGGLIERQTP